ncbi:hypothetical protein [Micromonospora sp. NPDC005171]|uniref:hypothetical protein n=1 Tax=Micromonospora sp. NPDC005171 TaxID=3156866 RepID=UPI0033BBAE92
MVQVGVGEQSVVQRPLQRRERRRQHHIRHQGGQVDAGGATRTELVLVLVDLLVLAVVAQGQPRFGRRRRLGERAQLRLRRTRRRLGPDRQRVVEVVGDHDGPASDDRRQRLGGLPDLVQTAGVDVGDEDGARRAGPDRQAGQWRAQERRLDLVEVVWHADSFPDHAK